MKTSQATIIHIPKSWNFRIKKSSMNKVKNESLQWSNREVEQTLLSDSFVCFFFHLRRDQMNAGKNKQMQTIREAAHSEILFVVWLSWALLL